MYKKKAKPKYANGAFINDNAGAIGMGTGFVGDMLSAQGGAGGIAGGVLKGVGAGAAAGLPGMVIGGLTGLVGGIFGNAQKKKEEEAKKLQMENYQKSYLENTSRTNLAGYDTYGVNKSFYAKGGLIEGDYEVEKGEVIQGNPVLEEGQELSSDMFLVGGNSHEQGGTEGMGGERVFSDRLHLDKDTIAAFKTLDIKLPSNSTYAKAAEIIGKRKGKAEEKLDSKIAPSIRTGKRMMEDHDNALDVLFNIQEITKPMKREVRSYSGGGNLPKINSGLINPKALGSPKINLGNVVTPEMATPPINGRDSNGIGNWLKNNEGQLINAASYVTNLNSINKLDTTIKRNYLPTPKYNYVDRTGAVKNDNLNAYKSTLGALESTSQGVNASNAGALYGRMLEANSMINNQENARRDNYDDNYGNRVDRTTMINNNTFAEVSDTERDMGNEKNVALPMQARNAFLQGYAGNTAMSQKTNLDKQRMLLSAYLNDSNGVMSRLKGADINRIKELPIYKMFNN